MENLKNRLTMTSEPIAKKSTKTEKTTKQAIVLDDNSPAPARLTYALYQANRAASKINNCKVFNDWHKQGLTVKEANDFITEYNKVTGYVYKPKEKEVKKETKKASAKTSALDDILRENGITPDQLVKLLSTLKA